MTKTKSEYIEVYNGTVTSSNQIDYLPQLPSFDLDLNAKAKLERYLQKRNLK